jgi:hypothetical protein
MLDEMQEWENRDSWRLLCKKLTHKCGNDLREEEEEIII